MKKRIVFTFAVVSIFWVTLLLRAFFIQVFPNERLDQLRQRQFQTVIKLEGRRGVISDRNGRELALSTPAYSLFADPKLIGKKKKTAARIAKELGVSSDFIFQKIKDSQKRFVWLQRRMSKGTAERIKSLQIKGLAFIEEWKRVYPNDSLLAPTLGFVGQEGQGLEGLELQYDSYLQGNQQKINVRRDARGRPLMTEGLIFADNPDGHDLKLTIDSELQYTLENELLSAVREFEADSAVGVVLDANSSAVRALASVPSADANIASQIRADLRRNRAVTDMFEPGSTLKTFVVAAALREKILQPNSKFFCENGSYKIGDRIIREADEHHKFGWLTASEILMHSSNIGTTKIAFQLGEDKLRQALLDFGFSQKLGLDVPGETKGVVQALPWNNHLLSNVSFGQGMTVSAIQLANAYAAIANGGSLHKPYLVESVRDSETGRVTEFQPEKIHQVLSPEQAANMRLMLSSVTAAGGTGEKAIVNGYLVGGKTGTAQKVNPKAKGYLPGAYISSFAGFIPASDPKFVIFIAVDQPRKAYYGSQVAAPIFSRVASYAARREGLAPTLLNGIDTLTKNTQLETSEETDASKKIETLKTLSNANVSLWTPFQEISEKGALKAVETVPNLQGLSLREVLQQVGGKEIRVKIHGQGMVSQTSPAAGEVLPESQEVHVFLE